MVSADEGDSVGVAYFKRKEEEECFDGVVAAVNEVTEEEVVFVGAFAAYFEEFDEVVELAVDVAADLLGVFWYGVRMYVVYMW